MYPIGVLFGLGFDTATEVALLVLSGTAVASGLPFYAILSLPILFAAGHEHCSTRIDGCFMNFAYGWAFARPIRKVYYNITITGLSVAVAFFIGDDRDPRAAAGRAQLERRLLGLLRATSTSTRAGFIIVGLFVVTWVVALAIWRFGRSRRAGRTPRRVRAEVGKAVHEHHGSAPTASRRFPRHQVRCRSVVDPSRRELRRRRAAGATSLPSRHRVSTTRAVRARPVACRHRKRTRPRSRRIGALIVLPL